MAAQQHHQENGTPLPSNGVHHRRKSSVSEAAKATVKTVAAVTGLAVTKDADAAQRYRRIISKNLKLAIPTLVLVTCTAAIFYRLCIYRYPQAPVFPVLSHFNRSFPIQTCEETPNRDWTRVDRRVFSELRLRCLSEMRRFESLSEYLTDGAPCGVPAIHFGVPVKYACFKSASGHFVELVNPVLSPTGDARSTDHWRRAASICADADTMAETPVFVSAVFATTQDPPLPTGSDRDNGCAWKTTRRRWRDEDAYCIQQLVMIMDGNWPCYNQTRDVPRERLL